MKLAHDCFRRAQSCDPSYQPAWVCEAHVAEVIGETAEALDMYRHATELEYSVCLFVIVVVVVLLLHITRTMWYSPSHCCWVEASV